MRIGLVVHPQRDIEREMDALRTWASDRWSELAQVGDQDREVAEPGSAEDCDVIATLGGDGTALTGVRVASEAERPVLGVACGSLGVLTSVTADELPHALDRFSAGEWIARNVPGLEVACDDAEPLTALNDAVLIRDGEGQVTTSVHVDGVLYARFVGDGFVVSTPAGSSAYTLAAGGPLLAPAADGFVLTPLSNHGGSCPPLVLGSHSELRLGVDTGHAGGRLEVDGATYPPPDEALTIRLRTGVATLVRFDDSEPLLSALRRRRILMDSPRVLARDQREGQDAT